MYKLYGRFSSKDVDNCLEDEDVVIMKGFGSASKKYAESSSDSDNKEYDFKDEQNQRKVTQMEKDVTINKWRRLKSLKPQGMHLNDWLKTHFSF